MRIFLKKNNNKQKNSKSLYWYKGIKQLKNTIPLCMDRIRDPLKLYFAI